MSAMEIQTTHHERLRAGSLGLPQIIASTLANIAPAMSFFFGFGLIVGGAGVGAPLTIAVAMIVILFQANTLTHFTRFRPSAGSFVTFIGMAFGPVAAAAASVFVVTGYCIAASSVVAISGGWASETLAKFAHIHIAWQLIAVVVTVIVGTLVARGISLSTKWAAVFFYFELVLLLVGAVIMLVVNRGHLSMAPLEFSSVKDGWKGIGLGFPLAIYMFIGWENSAMLAEETENPRRNIPKALVTGTLAIGVVYMFLAFATETAFHHNAASITGAAIPFVDAFKASAGGILIIAYLAGVTSIFSSLIGLTNAQARILFNSSREGLLPRFFSKIHPEHRTPVNAMWAYIVVALLIVLGFGTVKHIDPETLFAETSTLGTIPVVVTYLLTNLALPIYMLRFHRAQFKAFWHLFVPLLGIVFMAFPLHGLIEPGQPHPYNVFPWLALGLLVVSAIYGAVLIRRNPDIAGRVGSFIADEEHASTSS